MKAFNRDHREDLEAIQELCLRELSRGFADMDRPPIFHGGTAIHAVWGSPRFSEDLDFMCPASSREAVESLFDGMRERLQPAISSHFPGYALRIKSKPRNGLSRYFIIAQGNVAEPALRVKLELFHAEDWQLDLYGAEWRQIGETSDRILAGQVGSIVADKITALGFRSFLKWRDLYDMDYLHKHYADSIPDPDTLIWMVHKQGLMYTNDIGELADRLAVIRRMPEEDLVRMAQQDMKPFLRHDDWATMWPAGIAEIVQFNQDVLQKVEKAARRHRPVSVPVSHGTEVSADVA